MFEITNELLTRILIFIVVLFISFTLLQRFFRDKKVSAIISLSLSFLSIWYLRTDQLEFLTSTYGYMGFALVLLFPFIIALFFIYSSEITGALRKIFWIFYGTTNFFLLNNKIIFRNTSSDLLLLIIPIATILMVIFDSWIKTKLNVRRNLKRTN